MSKSAVLLQIFHARWAEYMDIEQQSAGTSSVGSQWVDGSGCGKKLLKICKTNGVFLAGDMTNDRIGNTDQWDVTMVTAAIQAVTKAIRKSKHSS